MTPTKANLKTLLFKYQKISKIPFEILDVDEDQGIVKVHFDGDDLIINNKPDPIYRTISYGYLIQLIHTGNQKPAWFVALCEEKGISI